MLREELFFPKFQRTPGKIFTDRLKRKNPMKFEICGYEGIAPGDLG
jgi:hypothetical protein